MPWWRSNREAEEDVTYLDPRRRHFRERKKQKNSKADTRRALEALSSEGSLKRRIYRVLSNEFEEIRLVILLPATDSSSPIECRLEHTNLGRSRPYEALSYVWGMPEFTQEIILDGQPFHVTSNLETALRQLRNSHEERVLWIDAISIDQTDLDERRVQIGYMRTIYSHCSRDLCWLGPEDESVIRGINILRKLEGFRLADIESLAWMRYDYKGRNGETTRTSWTPNKKDWSALRTLLQDLAIWERVWIVQEISCSPNVLLVCGSTELDWAVIEGFLQGETHSTDAFHSPFSHDSDSLTKLFETAQVIKTQRQLSTSLTEGGESSLLDVLARFRFTVATDKKDKVFALLGLVSDDLGVPVDYKKSVVDVYIDTTRRLINASANLDIICQSQWQSLGNESRHPGVPSWVPDFSEPGRGRFLFAQRSIFAAGLPECKVPCEISGTAISLSGVLLGELNQLPGHAYKHFQRMQRNEGMKWDQKRRLHISEWARSFDYPNQSAAVLYRTGESKFRAFCRTIAADCFAFPMRRLTEHEIYEDEALLARSCRDIENGPNVGDMISYRMILELGSDWRFGITNTDLFAMVPIGSQQGDVVAVLSGGKVPFVLRPVQREAFQETQYRFIGGAYVHGCMDGEAASFDVDAFQRRTFDIV
jgi:hypothetical protein